MIVKELVGTVTENDGFSICLFNIWDRIERHGETNSNGIVANLVK